MIAMIKSFLSAIADMVKPKKPEKIPQTFDDAVNVIIEMVMNLREDDRSYLLSQTSPHMFAAITHHNIGRMVRNDWQLWVDGSPLYLYMKRFYGISHADDISGVIFMCAWQKMTNKAMTPKVFADACLEYWKTIEENGENGVTIEMRDGEVIAHPRKSNEADTVDGGTQVIRVDSSRLPGCKTGSDAGDGKEVGEVQGEAEEGLPEEGNGTSSGSRR